MLHSNTPCSFTTSKGIYIKLKFAMKKYNLQNTNFSRKVQVCNDGSAQ